jgi:hypothetical protein
MKVHTLHETACMAVLKSAVPMQNGAAVFIQSSTGTFNVCNFDNNVATAVRMHIHMHTVAVLFPLRIHLNTYFGYHREPSVCSYITAPPSPKKTI